MKLLKEQKNFYNYGWKHRPCSEDIRYYRWVVGLIKNFVKNGRLLDIGCGEGILLKEGEKYFETYGIDISETAIKRARKICKKTKFKVVAAEKMNFQKNYFDCITCLGSLEHFINPETVLKKILRFIKKDGIVVIVLPNQWYIVDFIYRGLIRGESQTHGQMVERFNSRVGWKNFLEKNGLKVIKIEKYNPHNAPVPKKINYFLIREFFQLIWKFFRWFIPTNVSYQFCYICKGVE